MLLYPSYVLVDVANIARRYAASKVAAEKAFWDFVKEKNPHFTANAVLPPMILGQPLHKSHAEAKAAYIRQLITGDTAFLETMPASKFVSCIPLEPLA